MLASSIMTGDRKSKVGSDDEIEQDGTSRANLKQITINDKTFLISLDQVRDRELLEL